MCDATRPIFRNAKWCKKSEICRAQWWNIFWMSLHILIGILFRTLFWPTVRQNSILNLQRFWDITRTVSLNIETSKQILMQNACFYMFLSRYILDLLSFKLEKKYLDSDMFLKNNHLSEIISFHCAPALSNWQIYAHTSKLSHNCIWMTFFASTRRCLSCDMIKPRLRHSEVLWFPHCIPCQVSKHYTVVLRCVSEEKNVPIKEYLV